MCPMHSETKPTKMSELGAEKGYCRDDQEEQVAHAQKNLNSPVAFKEGFLKATFKVRAVGCMTFF